MILDKVLLIVLVADLFANIVLSVAYRKQNALLKEQNETLVNIILSLAKPSKEE